MRTLHGGSLHGKIELYDHIQHHDSKNNCPKLGTEVNINFLSYCKKKKRKEKKSHYYLDVTSNYCATED